nr:unnamed protein product [Callosobruchus analis]
MVHELLEDDERPGRPGRPVEMIMKDKVALVEELVISDRRRIKSGEVRWRCVKKNLRCLAKLYTVGAEYTVTRSELIHNHESDETTSERKIVTTSCKRKAEEDISEKPSKIIKSVLSNHLPENLSSTDVSNKKKFVQQPP